MNIFLRGKNKFGMDTKILNKFLGHLFLGGVKKNLFILYLITLNYKVSILCTLLRNLLLSCEKLQFICFRNLKCNDPLESSLVKIQKSKYESTHTRKTLYVLYVHVM